MAKMNIASVLLLATSYFISPSGNDANSGKGNSSPWKTFAHAFSIMVAGDTLNLSTGTYGSSTGTGYVNANCSTNAKNGTATAPITIQAQSERQSVIQGDGSGPIFVVQNCAYWSVIGIHFEDVPQVDNAGGCNVNNISPGGGAVNFSNSSHIIFRRNIAAHDNYCCNAHMVAFGPGVTNSLEEENEYYYYHREPNLFWNESNGNESRRNYANPRNWAGAHTCISPNGTHYTYDPLNDDPAFFNYGSSNNIHENNITENGGHSFGGEPIGTYPAACGHGNVNNQGFGNISLNIAYGYATHPHSTGPLCILNNDSANNYVAINPSIIGVYFRSATNMSLLSSTIFSPASSTNAVAQDVAGSGGSPNVPLGSSNPTSTITNSEVVTTVNPPGFLISSGTSTMSHDGAYTVSVSNATVTSPITTNPNFGACYIWVPDASPLKKAGVGGVDVGANILYQTVGGVLTNTRLWNITTGAPLYKGATVVGLNDMAPGSSCVSTPFGHASGNGCSLFDIANRLHINQGGCNFPAVYTANNYYVNVNTGSDTNSGLTATTAWKTIPHAITAFTMGTTTTTIHVANGTYPAGIDQTRGGTSTSVRLVIQCDNGIASALLAKGQCIITGSTFGWLVEANNVDIIGFDIGNNASMSTALAAICNPSGVPCTTGNSVHFIGNYTHDLAGNIYNSAHTVGPGCPENGAIGGGAHGHTQTDIQTLRNVVLNFGSIAMQTNPNCNVAQGIYHDVPADHAIIQDNIVIGIPVGGIIVEGCNYSVSNNTIINTRDGIIFSGTGGTDTAVCPGGVAGHITVANNAIFKSQTTAYWFTDAVDCTNTTPTLHSHNISDGLTPDYSGFGCCTAPTSCDTVTPNPWIHQAGTSYFVNYQTNGTGDYHLKSGSLGTGAGSTNCVTGGFTPCTPTNDFDGKTFNAPPSVGAYEFLQGAGPPSPPTTLTININ